MKITEHEFGILSNGEKISLFTIYNGTMKFSVSNYGCCITSVLLPSKYGGFDDVVLGYSSFLGYINNYPRFGSFIGRYAGRISNAEFSIGVQQYPLTPNDNGKHCLHSGYPFFDKILYDAEPFKTEHEAGVKFSRTSPDGEQGFPGNLKMEISYSLTPDNEIILRYNAKTDKPTPVNFTNHSYFNLNPAGMQSNGSFVSVLNHELQIFSEKYLETNLELIPTGKILSVENTGYDFREPRRLKDGADTIGGSYDNTWLIRKKLDDQKALAACLHEPITKRTLRVYSNQPALIIYTSGFLNNEQGKNGDVYNNFAGICFESQALPNSVNQKDFPNTILMPNEEYNHETLWHFQLD